MPSLAAYKPEYMSGCHSLARPGSPTPVHDRLKANSWMHGPLATDPSFRANIICSSAATAAKQQGTLQLPTAEEAAAEAARNHEPRGSCCSGCASGHPCSGGTSHSLPYSSAADLSDPCGGLPYEDDAAAVYSCCAAMSPRPKPLVLPTPEEAAAEVAGDAAGVRMAKGGCRCGHEGSAAWKGLGSPSMCGSQPRPGAALKTGAHPCSPNYSPRGGYFSPMPTSRCDPDLMSAPRPVSPCCGPLFVDAHVRDRPYSSGMLAGNLYSPIGSPRHVEAAPTPGGRRYPSPAPNHCADWSSDLHARPSSPSGYAARPYFDEPSAAAFPLPIYSKFPTRPVSPPQSSALSGYAARPYSGYPTSSNLLPNAYGGHGYTDGRHLVALNLNYEPTSNIHITSPRGNYLDHLARIEEETQRLRMELRGF